jgi:molybdopterin converting factor small subunit
MLRRGSFSLKRGAVNKQGDHMFKTMIENAPPTMNIVQRYVRPRLPAVLRYGTGWKVVLGTFYALAFAAAVAIFREMFPEQAEVKRRADEYVIVKDERGRAVGLGYRPIVEAAEKAKERNRRLRDGDV